jgi:hypothetical protein
VDGLVAPLPSRSRLAVRLLERVGRSRCLLDLLADLVGDVNEVGVNQAGELLDLLVGPVLADRRQAVISSRASTASSLAWRAPADDPPSVPYPSS